MRVTGSAPLPISPAWVAARVSAPLSAWAPSAVTALVTSGKLQIAFVDARLNTCWNNGSSAAPMNAPPTQIGG